MLKTIAWEQREPHPEDDSEDIRKVVYTSPAHGARVVEVQELKDNKHGGAWHYRTVFISIPGTTRTRLYHRIPAREVRNDIKTFLETGVIV